MKRFQRLESLLLTVVTLIAVAAPAHGGGLKYVTSFRACYEL
jgi:hypothetical protein